MKQIARWVVSVAAASLLLTGAVGCSRRAALNGTWTGTCTRRVDRIGDPTPPSDVDCMVTVAPGEGDQVTVHIEASHGELSCDGSATIRELDNNVAQALVTAATQCTQIWGRSMDSYGGRTMTQFSVSRIGDGPQLTLDGAFGGPQDTFQLRGDLHQ